MKLAKINKYCFSKSEIKDLKESNISIFPVPAEKLAYFEMTYSVDTSNTSPVLRAPKKL